MSEIQCTVFEQGKARQGKVRGNERKCNAIRYMFVPRQRHSFEEVEVEVEVGVEVGSGRNEVRLLTNSLGISNHQMSVLSLEWFYICNLTRSIRCLVAT